MALECHARFSHLLPPIVPQPGSSGHERWCEPMALAVPAPQRPLSEAASGVRSRQAFVCIFGCANFFSAPTRVGSRLGTPLQWGSDILFQCFLGGGGSAGATTLFLEIGIAAFAADSRTGLFNVTRLLRSCLWQFCFSRSRRNNPSPRDRQVFR